MASMAETLETLASVRSAASLLVRWLPPEEWEKLDQIPVVQEFGRPSPDNARVLVAEDLEGKIQAYWFMFLAVHVEPMWFAEEYRNNPTTVRRMWGGVREAMMEHQIPIAFAVIADHDPANYASRLGFERLHGDLYFVRPEASREVQK